MVSMVGFINSDYATRRWDLVWEESRRTQNVWISTSSERVVHLEVGAVAKTTSAKIKHLTRTQTIQSSHMAQHLTTSMELMFSNSIYPQV